MTNKKEQSTYDRFMQSLTVEQKRALDKEYRELLLLELLLAENQGDAQAVANLKRELNKDSQQILNGCA
jgi:hypothetical protein